MTDIEALIARLEGLMAKATPTEGEFRHEPTDYVFQRYSVRGVPCGFPVAIFGDDADASFFVGVKDALPALIAHIRALSGAVEAEQWQPIETAPKDGTDILLYVPGDCDSPYHILTGYWETNQWSDNTRGSYWGFEPTHWKSLSLPPSDAKDRP